MVQHVSPGVFVTITDLSEYVREVPSTIGFIPIICEKGPDNELIYTNGRDFIPDFGEPNILYAGRKWSQGPYVANNFLKESDSLYVMRCMPNNAEFANLLLTVTSGTAVASNVDSMRYKSELRDQVNITSSGESLDTTSGDHEAAVIFYGIGRGTYYNDFEIEITHDTRGGTSYWKDTKKYILKIYQKQITKDTFSTTTDTDEYQYVAIETFEVSFDPTSIDTDGGSIWVEDIVNSYSKNIRCYANEIRCQAISDLDTTGGAFDVTTATSLANGSNGELFMVHGGATIIDDNHIEELLIDAYSGDLDSNDTLGAKVTSVNDTENYYFSLVFECYNSAAVKTAIVTLAETRGDCVAILDNGDNSSVTTSITRTTTDGINTKYAAIYEPYTKVYDNFTGRSIWMSPVYHMAKVIPKSDKLTDVWYAAAGPNRAMISGISDLRFNPLLSERDSMYLVQLNPIVRFNIGDMVFGQLTSQSRPTALQDLNIVRLVLYIQRALEQFCRYYLFEQNDSETWESLTTNINSFLRVIQNKRGLYSYSVEVGATDYEIKRKTIHANVTLFPTRTTEQINLNFFIK
jgi:hypothetical protein